MSTDIATGKTSERLWSVPESTGNPVLDALRQSQSMLAFLDGYLNISNDSYHGIGNAFVEQLDRNRAVITDAIATHAERIQ